MEHLSDAIPGRSRDRFRELFQLDEEYKNLPGLSRVYEVVIRAHPKIRADELRLAKYFA